MKSLRNFIRNMRFLKTESCGGLTPATRGKLVWHLLYIHFRSLLIPMVFLTKSVQIRTIAFQLGPNPMVHLSKTLKFATSIYAFNQIRWRANLITPNQAPSKSGFKPIPMESTRQPHITGSFWGSKKAPRRVPRPGGLTPATFMLFLQLRNPPNRSQSLFW